MHDDEEEDEAGAGEPFDEGEEAFLELPAEDDLTAAQHGVY